MNTNQLSAQAFINYVKENNVSKIRLIFDSLHPAEVSEIVENWELDQIKFVLKSLLPKDTADLFIELSPKLKEKILSTISKANLTKLIDELFVDEVVKLIDDIDEKFSKKIISATPASMKKELLNILKYSDNTAAHHMTIDYVSIKLSGTVASAINNIKKQYKANQSEIVGSIFVVNKDNVLVGQISPEALIAASSITRIASIIDTSYSIPASSSIESVIDKFSKYNDSSVPITDSKGKLIGVVEPEAIIEELDETMDESLGYEGVKVTALPYSKQSSKDLFKARWSWLIILLVIGSLSQLAVMGFQILWSSSTGWGTGGEALMLSSVIAVVFTTALSMTTSVVDSSGNAGSQVSATVIRALALGDITNQDMGKTIKKESKAAFYLGSVAALVSFVRIWLIWILVILIVPSLSFSALTPELVGWYALMATITSLTFMISILIGNILGVWIPMIADKRKIDGAVVSGPLITTIVDIVVLIIYFGMVSAIFIPLFTSGILPDSSSMSEVTSRLLSMA